MKQTNQQKLQQKTAHGTFFGGQYIPYHLTLCNCFYLVFTRHQQQSKFNSLLKHIFGTPFTSKFNKEPIILVKSKNWLWKQLGTFLKMVWKHLGSQTLKNWFGENWVVLRLGNMMLNDNQMGTRKFGKKQCSTPSRHISSNVVFSFRAPAKCLAPSAPIWLSERNHGRKQRAGHNQECYYFFKKKTLKPPKKPRNPKRHFQGLFTAFQGFKAF